MKPGNFLQKQWKVPNGLPSLPSTKPNSKTQRQNNMPLRHPNSQPTSNIWNRKIMGKKRLSVSNSSNNITKQLINREFYEQQQEATAMEVVAVDNPTIGANTVGEEDSHEEKTILREGMWGPDLRQPTPFSQPVTTVTSVSDREYRTKNNKSTNYYHFTNQQSRELCSTRHNNDVDCCW